MEVMVGTIWGVTIGYAVAILAFCFLDKKRTIITHISFKEGVKIVEEELKDTIKRVWTSGCVSDS